MSANSFSDLMAHIGHDLECVTYENEGIVYNVAIECLDCQEIVLDFDNPALTEGGQEVS